MKQYSINDLELIIKKLNNSLPEKVPLNFSKNIDLIRATILRESIFYRIRELAESAYDACLKDRLVTAILVGRGLMETETLFKYFVGKLEKVIKDNKFDEIKNFLTKALQGARVEIATKKFNRPNSINVLTAIDYINEKISGYRDQYEFLCEFSHPNSAGLNKIYCRYDWDRQEVIFGNNREKINIDFMLKQLCISSEYFISEYDYSAELFDRWLALDSKEIK